MAETVPVVGAGFFDALRAYASDVEQAAEEATALGLQHIQEGLRQQAATQDRWADLASNITVFSQDGRLVVGVPGGEFSSEAQAAHAAEYGLDDQPPAPLFRTNEYLQQEARQVANSYLDTVLGRVVT